MVQTHKSLTQSGCLVLAALVLAAWPVQADEAQDRFRSETEVRLMEMESRFRTVTGQYEEAMYRLTQMNRQLENALADMEFRLQQLERGDQPAPILPDLTGSGPIILDGYIYGAGYDQRGAFCLKLSSGALKYRHQPFTRGSYVYADGLPAG